MCNDYRLETDIASIAEDFEGLKMIRMPEGLPNVAAREDIRITDVAPIVRSVAQGARNPGVLSRGHFTREVGRFRQSLFQQFDGLVEVFLVR